MTIAISAAREAEISGQEDNPFFAWDNLAATATFSAFPGSLDDGSPANAFTGSTFDWWRADVTATTATLQMELATPASVTFAAVAAHNLSDFGATIRLYRSADGVSYTDAGNGPITPSDNDPIGFRVSSGSATQWWRFYVTGLTAGDALRIGMAFVGSELISPVRFYQGFAPILTPTEVNLQSNVSQGGHLLGSSVVSRGSRLEFELQHMEDSFVRGSEWLGFQRSFNECNPCFFGWRPEKYPADLHYMWRDGPVVRPVNSGPRALMSAGVSARVHEG